MVMASSMQGKENQASDVSDANRERSGYGEVKMESDHRPEQKSGVIATLYKSVAGTFEHAKEAVTGGKARGSGAQTAMDVLSGKKEEIKQKAYQDQAADPSKGGEVGADTECEAGRKLQEQKLQQEGNEYDDEDRRKAEADWETAANRGTATRSNIYGAMGSVEEAIEEKLTMPTDIVKETRSASEYGGPKRAEVAKVLVDLEETPAEAATSDLEDADRMASRSFDNVGRGDN